VLAIGQEPILDLRPQSQPFCVDGILEVFHPDNSTSYADP